MKTKRSRRYAEIRVTQTFSKVLAHGIIFSQKNAFRYDHGESVNRISGLYRLPRKNKPTNIGISLTGWAPQVILKISYIWIEEFIRMIMFDS